MRKFGNYLLDQQLYQGKRTEVWRAHAQETNLPVIMKLPVGEYPSQIDLSRIKHEYDLLKKLDVEGVIHPVEFVVSGRSCGLALEDHGETILADVVQKTPLALDEFLNIAIQLVRIIGELHEKGVINKDIKLENILINLMTRQVRLIDFSIASEISREYQEFSHPDSLEGTLAYISPEQTGRMNRAIDYRTDFYSLGITFYKILTGHFPFEANTPMEMVHAHIAKMPTSPHLISSNIPPVISKIIMKLLEKNCENRYKSSRSLLQDLVRCNNSLKETGQVYDFEIAKNDIPVQFIISQKLYGRENEIATLLNVFENTTKGQVQVILIKGYAGVGKTAIINEVHQPITERNGFFVQGKFDQFRRDIAYGAISTTLQDFAQQLLHLPEAELQIWKDNLLKAVGKNGKILTNLAPDFEKVIGVQADLEELPPQQTLNRFYYTFQSLIRTIATEDHPLVISLDDLQWADNGSLDLIEELASSEVSAHLLIIGAYRSNELIVGQPLYQTIEKLNAKNVLSEIELSPLNLDNVTALLSDTLYVDNKSVKLLAHYVFQKTEGNPFYINVLLIHFFRESLIYFDHGQGQWTWDLEKIQSQKVSENVVEYLIDRLRQLPEQTQHLVQLAACIGNSFNLNVLSTIFLHSNSLTAQILETAIIKGIIIPISNGYRAATAHVEQIKQNMDFDVSYQFAHDRVQQAAYQLLDSRKRSETHLAIARLLFKKYNEEEKEKEIMNIAHHFNLAIDLITDRSERLQVAELNYEAALRARRSSAFQVSIQQCEYAEQLLQNNPWESHYTLIFNITMLYAEAAYLLAKYEEAEKKCSLLLKHAESNFEKANVLYMQALQYIAKNDYKKAFPLSVKALRLVDVHVPMQPNIFKVSFAFMRALLRLRKADPNEFLKKEISLDPSLNLAARLFGPSFTCAYFTKNVKFMVLGLSKVIDLIIDRPLTLCSSAYADTLMMFYIQTFKNYQRAHDWYILGKSLNAKHPDAEMILNNTISYITFLALLFEHEHEIYQLIQQGITATLESGNKYYIPMFYALLFLTKPGTNATEICQLANDHYPLVKNVAIRDMLDMYLLRYAYYFNITNQTPSYESISYTNFNEDDFLQNSANTKYHIITYIYYTVKMRLAYLYGDYKAAEEYLNQAIRYKGTEAVIFNLRELYLYSFLIPAKRWGELTFFQKKRAKRQMKNAYKWIKSWSDFCPLNFLHHKLLLDAEWAHINGNLYQAQQYYNQAISAAQQNNYPERETFIHEQAALFYLKNNLNRHAGIEMYQALLGYQQQGASRKVSHILQHYQELIKEATPSQIRLDETKTENESTSESNTEESLDLDTIIAVSRTISGEIQLRSLLEKMLKILIACAGAQSGALLLKINDNWFIQAQGDSSHIEVLQKIPLELAAEEHIPICRNIIDYVMRSLNSVVLGNASQIGDFRNDPYITAHHCRSIICLPLINQGTLRGLLYLENDLTIDAFTQNRQQILHSISSLAAIALENATLYDNLKSLNLSYEQFVPKEFINLLEKRNIQEVSLGDQTLKKMTVMFADIRHFTNLTELMTPQDSFNFLNLFLSYMEPLIQEHHGFIDKYIGDAIMALFPNTDDAVQCSVRMLEKLNEFNALDRNRTVRIGIGLNTGPLILGIVGGENHLETTVISDSVNIASRVEGLNKKYGTEMLISENTLQTMQNVRPYYLRFIANAKLRGKRTKLKIYEVFNHNEDGLKNYKLETREEFEKAVQLYEQNQYKQAEIIFSKLISMQPLDTACQVYLQHLSKKTGSKTS